MVVHNEKIQISISEYHQKRFEIARDLLASTVGAGNINMTNTETKESESIVYNCAVMADMLLAELGYIKESANQEDMSINNLKDILRNSKG